jgi:acetyl esterase
MIRYWLFAILAAGAATGVAQEAVSGPERMVYKTVAGAKLTAHVFRPSTGGTSQPQPAVVLFHGGGWTGGSPEWVFHAAKRYASLGAVAVAAQYRLSGPNPPATPLDALEDARDAVRWMRRNAKELGIDPKHVAAYGVSAGGHLAASLAFFDPATQNEINAAPNAVVLISPSVSLGRDMYFQGLLGRRAKAGDLSPDEHVDGVPPTIIFVGGSDTLTPAASDKRYCDSVRQHGGECEVHVYPGVGHLFTRKGNDFGDYDPDPKAIADSTAKGEAFLAAKGFLPLARAAAEQ